MMGHILAYGYLPFIWAQPIYLLNQQLRSSAKVLFGSHSQASKKRRLPLLPKKQTSFDILKSEPFVTQQGKPLSSEAMHRVFQQVS